MRISRLLPLPFVILALLRCAPPDACVRESDCGDGLTCHAGTCKPAAPSEATPVEGGVAASSDASSSSTTPTSDAGTAAPSGTDAGEADAESDAGADTDSGDVPADPPSGV